ncbi:MAG: hypothetical protein ACRC8Y_15680 [Chroococcales cyanobacterium]
MTTASPPTGEKRSSRASLDPVAFTQRAGGKKLIVARNTLGERRGFATFLRHHDPHNKENPD